MCHWRVLGAAGLLLAFAITRPFIVDAAALGLLEMAATAQADGTILTRWMIAEV